MLRTSPEAMGVLPDAPQAAFARETPAGALVGRDASDAGAAAAELKALAAEAPAPLPEDAAPGPSSSAPLLIDSIQPGHRLRMVLQGQWTDVRLTWRSDNGHFFLFASRLAGRSHSIARRTLEAMAARGHVLSARRSAHLSGTDRTQPGPTQ